MKLTNCQETGHHKMSEWLKSQATTSLSDRVFVLTGKAGTGKTTLIRYVLEKYIKEISLGNIDAYNYPDVLGVAMAHKAKEVLRGSLPDVTTFASYFGFKAKYLENGTTVFEREHWNKNNMLLCDFPIKFVVHDEVSMYSQTMLDHVLQDSHINTKIILMGDPGQLPPIQDNNIKKEERDNDSPVFIMRINDSSKHHLVERVRQKEDNPIIELSDIIYKEIFGTLTRQAMINVYDAINKNINDGNFGYSVINSRDVLEDFKNSSDNYLDSKIISYRRAAVSEMNKRMRNYLFGNITEQYVKGDVIILNDTYYHSAGADNNQVDKSWKMYNSDEYKIINVTQTVHREVLCYDLFVDPTNKEHLKDKSNPFIRVVAPQGQRKYKEELDRLYTIASIETDKNRRVELFADYWDYKKLYGNVSYAYCLTAYKAQGSTIKNVYIDINDIILTKPISRKRKLQSIYTALTRATNKATFITNREV